MMDLLILKEIDRRIETFDERIHMYEVILSDERKSTLHYLESDFDTPFLASSLEHLRATELSLKEEKAGRRALLGLMRFIDEDYYNGFMKEYEGK